MKRCLKVTCFLVLDLLHSSSLKVLYTHVSPLHQKVNLELRAFKLSKLLGTMSLPLPLSPSLTLL